MDENGLMKEHGLLIALCLLLLSCSLPPKYAGEKFAPTKTVDVFYPGDAIPRSYRIMGYLTSHHYIKTALKKNFMNYAKREGGDAVIIDGDGAGVLKYN